MPITMKKSKKKTATAKKRVRQPVAAQSAGPQPLVITHRDLFPKGSFARTGGMLGSVFGPTGAALGSTAGAMLSRITGVGDYTVKSNTLETTGGVIGGEVPHFGKENNSTRIRHREFITDIGVPSTPASFNNTSYVINPSNKTLFPWLANLAESWQQYRVHGMVFYFKSTTSDYAANGALGKIAMATNYNVRDSSYVNMQELENAEFSVSGKPSLSRLHPIECAPSNGLPLVRYVRDTQYDATGGDDRLYDIGKFQFATQGLPGSAGQVIGELWVSYDIEFFKPIVGREPASVAYEPVLIPQFNTFGGDSTTSLFQMERSTWTPPSAPTSEKLAATWTAIHRPDTFVRVAPVDIASARICHSATRPSPDPSSSVSSYPAYWADAVGTPNRVELRLTRPGIWYMNYCLELDQNPAQPQYLGSASSLAAPNGVVDIPVSDYTSYQLPAIDIAVRDSTDTLRPIDVQVLTNNCTDWGVHNSKENTFVSVGGGVPKATLYRNGPGWTLFTWVTEEMAQNGGYVSVRFQTPNETSTTIGPPFVYNNASTYSPNGISRAVFDIGVTSVDERTYYRPVVAALTSDDNRIMAESVRSLLALVPKLRENGFAL